MTVQGSGLTVQTLARSGLVLAGLLLLAVGLGDAVAGLGLTVTALALVLGLVIVRLLRGWV